MADRGIDHLRFLWEENVRALADDPSDGSGDTPDWIADLEAAGHVIGCDFWEFVKADTQITDFERERLAAFFSTGEPSHGDQ